MKKNLKGILYSENETLATDFIAGLEAKYLPAIKRLLNQLKHSGIEKPSKALIADRINESSTDEILSKDVGNALVHHLHFNKFQTAGELFASEFKSGTVPMKDPELLQFIEINESGSPYVPGEAKELIKESFREYLIGANEKVFLAQTEATKAMNNFFDSLIEAGMDEIGMRSSPALYYLKHFDFKEAEGRVMVSSTPIKFRF
ncbi:MAG: hypothetical protein LLF93_09415 [Bacteroidales bacterium]|nr:hypothetical protein [Bacteroidales bacterium]